MNFCGNRQDAIYVLLTLDTSSQLASKSTLEKKRKYKK